MSLSEAKYYILPNIISIIIIISTANIIPVITTPTTIAPSLISYHLANIFI